MNNDNLIIAGKSYSSRLLVGTGKYKDFAETKAAVEASGAEIITIAIRRSNIGQNPNEPSLLDILPPSKYTLLPNTAGCYSADDAVRTLRLARELLDGHSLVKLEVLGDPQSLYPNVVETLAAAKTLVKDGFQVMVYTSDDPIIAKQLEDIGCVAIMPLASLIGSGMGILNPWNLQLHGTRAGAGYRGCGRWHCLGRSHCDGAGLPWRADEYCDCRREKPRTHGVRHEVGGGGWAHGFPGRAHAAQAV